MERTEQYEDKQESLHASSGEKIYKRGKNKKRKIVPFQQKTLSLRIYCIIET